MATTDETSAFEKSSPKEGGLGSQSGAKPPKNNNPWTEVGSSGLAQYGGFIRDEFLPQLQGDRGLKVMREMYDNEPIIGALVFAIQMLLRQVEWRVEPPEAATVEQIVEEREQEKQKAAQQQQQAQNAKLMMAQAGLADNASKTSPTGPGSGPAGAGGALPPKQQASHARPVNGPPGMHQALPAGQVARPLGGPPTAPQAPGPNPRGGITAPGNNGPATPNAPANNPTGGPAQDAATVGLPGLNTPGNPRKKDRDRNTVIQNSRWPSKLVKWFQKDSGGGTAGGLVAGDVGTTPIDPESMEDMEFAVGTGPTALDPLARHAEELAVFVETCLHDLDVPWADLVSQIVTMIVYGFSYHELVYKKRNGPNPADPIAGSRYSDGRIGWGKIAGRAQETRHRWEFDENGNVLGMWQLAPPHFEIKYIPLEKSLLFRTTAYKGNPEGRSLIRSAYRPWFFKRRIEEIEAIGVERDLAGLPLAYVPYQMMTSGATPEEKATLAEIKKLVRNIRRDEQDGVVFPMAFDPETKNKLYELTLLTSEGKRAFDTDKIIQRYEQRMAMVCLADFILFGHGDTGARSLGETKEDMFTTALEALLTAIADVFNTYAIPRLMQINGEDPAQSPKLTFGKLTRISLEEIAAFITALAGAGADMFPDVALEDYLRDTAGLPPKAASDDL